MRYGFLIESLSVASGGPSRVAGVIASALVERGHAVTIATLKEKEALVTLDERIEIRFLAPADRVFPRMRKIIHGIHGLASEVDVIVVSGIWGPVDGLALRIARMQDTPVYIRICGMLEDYILRRNAWKKQLARTLYVNANLHRATGLLVNTKIEGQHVKALGYKTDVKVIPNGVVPPAPDENLTRANALELMKLDVPDSTKVLLYLSRIHPKKGLHVFIPAFADFLKDHPDWILVVAGDYFSEDYKKQIETLISECRLQDKIVFTGEIAGSQKQAAFSLADAFVLPSESEGFSNAVVEALSWSLPVLITKGCNFPEVEEAGAGKVVDYNTDSLLHGLVALAGDPTDLSTFGKNARQLVEDKYLLADIVDKYESLALSK